MFTKAKGKLWPGWRARRGLEPSKVRCRFQWGLETDVGLPFEVPFCAVQRQEQGWDFVG